MIEEFPGALRSPRWRWVVAIWTMIALFDAIQTVLVMRAEGMHHDWPLLFFVTLLQWLPWAAATPFIVRLGRRYRPLLRARSLPAWAVHLVACCATGWVMAAWEAVLRSLLNPFANPGPPESFVHLWFYSFYNNLLAFALLYAAILTVSYVLDSRERLALHQTETARLNEQLSKAKFEALRRQIEPHFLFNALNAISGLVREGRDDAAVRMIAGLSDFLRRVVEQSNRQEVPLAEEMEFLQKYLEIQQLRFAERLRVEVEVPSDLLPMPVPSLILQPMVENALNHGIAKRVQGGAIRISAARSNGTLTLSVYNDGPGLPADWEAHAGVGIANVRARLHSLYGDAGHFSLHNQKPNGVQASLSLPLRKS
jgi:two-component system, LytTR family, sensor kinase